MIFFTAMMTAGTGAVAISNPHNLGTTYAVVAIASIGVGGVIIPCSIIAQIACPDELIATITAITLSIRYIGGAIGFAVYSNLFSHKFVEYATDIIVVKTILGKGIVSPDNVAVAGYLAGLVGNAKFNQLKQVIAASPLILRKDAYPLIIASAQEAFALAYRYPYWISIAFGALCFGLSFFVGDVTTLLTDTIAAAV